MTNIEGDIKQEEIKNVIKKDIPLLGICLGIQSIAASFGTKLTNVYFHKHAKALYVHDVY